MRIATAEIFSPVVAVTAFSSENEAVVIANDGAGYPQRVPRHDRITPASGTGRGEGGTTFRGRTVRPVLEKISCTLSCSSDLMRCQEAFSWTRGSQERLVGDVVRHRLVHDWSGRDSLECQTGARRLRPITDCSRCFGLPGAQRCLQATDCRL
ncbi:aldehyde dehydrogenase family protein [Streptomyces sp. NPDC096191]|uniref:aldehyde dehydrogenase family protein n=1 Tax=Streptomyces sp. NPDC096191 TaxID=3155426 RepID=UPI00332B65A3